MQPDSARSSFRSSPPRPSPAGALALFALASGLHAQSFPVASTLKLTGGLNGFALGPTSPATKGFLGAAVAALGDLDGDGTPDALFGQSDALTPAGGRIYVAFLEPDGSVRASHEITEGAGGMLGAIDPLDGFGEDVAALGDLDGDGTLEVAVGAPGDDDGASGMGAVWILSLDQSGAVVREGKISLLSTPGLGLLVGDAFGQAVEALGDLDGDGVCDLAVGAPGRDDGGSQRGAFWTLFLRSDGTVKGFQRVSATAGLFPGALDDGGQLGASLARLGDVDGNGSLELAVGQPFGMTAGTVTGAVWIVSLFSNGLVLDALEIEPGQSGFQGPLAAGDQFGAALEQLGDLDGDGIADLAAGAPGHDAPGGLGQGAVWLLYLAPDRSVRTQDRLTSGEAGLPPGYLKTSDRLGSSLATLGDLAGDGTLELLVGAPDDDQAGSSVGAVHVFSLDFCPHLAQAVYRNVPGNPSSYDAPPPFLGETWEATVNLRTTGHQSAWIFGMSDAFQLPLAGGQTLLVIDATGSGELLGLVPQPGPLARFSADVPRDGTFCGTVLHTQAVHLGGGKPFALSNAQDLVLGFRAPARPAVQAPPPQGL